MKLVLKKEKLNLIIEIIILVLIDQITKLLISNNKQYLPNDIIKNILEINYVENFGIAFGMAKGGTIFFIIINIIIIGIALKILFASKEKFKLLKKICLVLTISGGIGNLIDRIIRGYVIDYIDFSQVINFPVFNFADIMIVSGVIGIAIWMIFDVIKESKENQNLKGENN